MRKKFEKINVTEKTENEIRYCAKILNKTISGFLEELFGQIIQQAVNFKDGANVQYLVEYDDIRLRFSGSKMVTSGSFKSSASDAEVDKILESKTLEKIDADLKETFSEEENWKP
jgi:hypothetical protein